MTGPSDVRSVSCPTCGRGAEIHHDELVGSLPRNGRQWSWSRFEKLVRRSVNVRPSLTAEMRHMATWLDIPVAAIERMCMELGWRIVARQDGRGEILDSEAAE